MSAGADVTLVNLGCGSTPHPAFVNIDINPHPGVIAHDLRRGIPLPDASADLVYHSTMLSFFKPNEARRFMRECRRVLKPGGVLRVVTEDLEQMCRVYLEKLEAAWNGDEASADDYDWMILELYDQVTRERPGGGMSEFLRRPVVPNEAFIISRVGEQGRAIIAGARASLGRKPVHPGLRARIATAVRSRVLRMLFGEGAAEALDVGRFRLSGQASYRMYDRFSLRRLFIEAGFCDVRIATPISSACSYWHRNNLDLAPSGLPARPHALIMEGLRPTSGGVD